MIILLTALPGTGKTTALEKFLHLFKGDCYWILSKEIRNNKNERVGFEALTSDGQKGLFAHKEAIQSESMIGSYHVDLSVIDTIFSDSIVHEIKSPHALFVLDEIGRMEMLSTKFVESIDALFETDLPVLATIRHGDEWAEKYKQNPKVTVIEVTESNRDELPGKLVEIFTRQ